MQGRLACPALSYLPHTRREGGESIQGAENTVDQDPPGRGTDKVGGS